MKTESALQFRVTELFSGKTEIMPLSKVKMIFKIKGASSGFWGNQKVIHFKNKTAMVSIKLISKAL